MIDELRRKKFLESLSGRAPATASVEDEMNADEKIQNPDIDIDALIKSQEDAPVTDQPQVVAPKIDRVAERASNVQSDMMVGASHALLGLLSGSHNRMAMETKIGHKYLADKATEDKIAAKDLVKTNQNGKPIYTPAREAVDMEAYVQPKGGSNRNNKTQIKVFEGIDNPDDTVYGYVDPNDMKVYDSRTNQPLDMNTYRPKGETKNQVTTDQYGNIKNSNISRGGMVRKEAELAPGEGKEVSIPVTKIRAAEKVSSDYSKRASKYQDDLSNISMGKKALMDKNASPQEKKLAMGSVMKTVEQRMTDDDRSEYKGEASALVNFGNLIDMTTDNEVPPQVERAFIQAANNLERKINATSGLYRKSLVRSYAGSDKKLQSYIEEKLSTPSSIEGVYQPAEPRKSFKQEQVNQKSVIPASKAHAERKDAILREIQLREKAKKR